MAALSVTLPARAFAGKKVVSKTSARAPMRRVAVATRAVATEPATERKFNFSAGPAMLPLDILEEAQADMINYKGTGMSVMEMSHRGKDFMKIAAEAEADLRELVGIPDNYKVRSFARSIDRRAKLFFAAREMIFPIPPRLHLSRGDPHPDARPDPSPAHPSGPLPSRRRVVAVRGDPDEPRPEGRRRGLRRHRRVG